MALGSAREYAVCGAPGSAYVNCTVTPANWAPPSVCGDARCLATGKFQCLTPEG